MTIRILRHARAALMAILSPVLFALPAAADDVGFFPKWSVTDRLIVYSPNDLHAWSFGEYGGIYNTDGLKRLAFAPFLGRYVSAGIYAADATYKVMTLPYVPVDVELDASAVYHFGYGQEFGELAFAPTLRLKWLPWNNFVYSTYRIGLIGASFDTAVSKIEATGTRRDHTARYLNYVISEITFAPDESSQWEAFFRIHHRSGIAGLINNVTGGSNYVSLGFRVRD